MASSRGRGRISLGAAVLALLMTAAAAPAAPPRVSAEFFGMNNNELVERPETLGARVDAMTRAGVGSFRVPIPWAQVQPTPTAFNWESTDRQFAELARRGIRPVAFLAYGTGWAMRDEDRFNAVINGVPESDWRFYRMDPELFGAWAGRVAERYARDGHFWSEHPELPYLPIKRMDVWNEANLVWAFRPRPMPDEFGWMYRYARNRARARDPELQVFVGGISPVPVDFEGAISLSRFLNEMGEPWTIDGLNVGAYATKPEHIIASVRMARGWLDRKNLHHVPIAMPEWGWPSNPPYPRGLGDSGPTSPRAELFRQVADQLSRSDCNVTAISAFSWESSESRHHPDGWGLGQALSRSAGLEPTSAAMALGEVAARQAGAAADARRATIHHCGRSAPDRDGDGVEDQHDFAPLDPAVVQAAKPSAPSVYEPPLLAGDFAVGLKVSTGTGTWDGSPLPAREIEGWEHCRTDLTDCRLLPGAQNFVIPAETAGRVLRAVVRASNSQGTASARSAPSAVVETHPFYTSLPVLRGEARVGKWVWLEHGKHTAIPPTYRSDVVWESCRGTSCRRLEPRSGGYGPQTQDVGSRIRVTIVLQNTRGTATIVRTSDQVTF